MQCPPITVFSNCKNPNRSISGPRRRLMVSSGRQRYEWAPGLDSSELCRGTKIMNTVIERRRQRPNRYIYVPIARIAEMTSANGSPNRLRQGGREQQPHRGFNHRRRRQTIQGRGKESSRSQSRRNTRVANITSIADLTFVADFTSLADMTSTARRFLLLSGYLGLLDKRHK